MELREIIIEIRTADVTIDNPFLGISEDSALASHVLGLYVLRTAAVSVYYVLD